jgi:hypothetical protein
MARIVLGANFTYVLYLLMTDYQGRVERLMHKTRHIKLDFFLQIFIYLNATFLQFFDFLWCYHHQFAVNGPHHLN